MTFGDRLHELRTRCGQSLQDVADGVGSSKAHIWELEQGRSCNPTLDLMRKLAAHFNTTIAYLIGEAALSSQWRGMESAPKDGTQILVLAEEQGAYSWYVVSYAGHGGVSGVDYPWETEDGVSYHRDVPNWWQPLPPPPSPPEERKD